MNISEKFKLSHGLAFTQVQQGQPDKEVIFRQPRVWVHSGAIQRLFGQLPVPVALARASPEVLGVYRPRRGGRRDGGCSEGVEEDPIVEEEGDEEAYSV